RESPYGMPTDDAAGWPGAGADFPAAPGGGYAGEPAGPGRPAGPGPAEDPRGGPAGSLARGTGVGGGRPRRVWPEFGDAKIRTKVILVLLLPVLVIVSLAGVAVADAARSASSVASVERLARFGTELSDVVDGLQHERDAAALWLSAA